MKFDCIVFDTAPTGHTLRLLSFPSVLDKGFGKIMSMKNKFSGMFSQIQSMLGGQTPENMEDKLEQTKKVIEEVNKQFKDPVRLPSCARFVSIPLVLIPQFSTEHDHIRLCLHPRIFVPV
jgi:anion-transporting  ArsA/GET3 family ATPase